MTFSTNSPITTQSPAGEGDIKADGRSGGPFFPSSHQGIRKERSIRIWPMFDNEREETGRETFNLFYLLPLKDEGFERNLFPLFRIFRWKEDPKKGISTNLFWGFYKRVKREKMESWEIAHLVGMKREQGVKTFSFLKGLLRYQSDEKNANLRLFYLPFYLRWSLHHPTQLSLGTGKPPLQSLPVQTFSARADLREAVGGEE